MFFISSSFSSGISLCVLDGVMHGAGGEDRNVYNDSDNDDNNNYHRDDQNLEMLMIYDNSRQVWSQVRQGDLILNIEEY